VVRNIMLLLPSNTKNFTGRIFFVLLTLFLFYLFFHFGLSDPKSERVVFTVKAIDFQFRGKYMLYLLLGIVVYLAVLLIVSLLSINRVCVDITDGAITFYGLFTERTIATTDIASYSETVHRNVAKVFYGLLINLNDGKTVQVAEQNVQNVSDLKAYLNETGIPYNGQQKMKYPFN
ncbi:hypothetical protein, partial [Flavisolibacter nicotianae]|uniref:hypothetical protein n=1 Tax=Flavisolibacter nicotianae TaxID=2364882 RepID=UPI001968E682